VRAREGSRRSGRSGQEEQGRAEQSRAKQSKAKQSQAKPSKARRGNQGPKHLKACQARHVPDTSWSRFRTKRHDMQHRVGSTAAMLIDGAAALHRMSREHEGWTSQATRRQGASGSHSRTSKVPSGSSCSSPARHGIGHMRLYDHSPVLQIASPRRSTLRSRLDSLVSRKRVVRAGHVAVTCAN
jgi:hypothetical protein